MNPQTLAALKESIEHWKRLSTGTTKDDENSGVKHCSLCQLFLVDRIFSEECIGCPIYEKTEQQHCEGSPYIASIHYPLGKKDPLFQEHAKKMLAFLISLLPPEEQKAYVEHNMPPLP